MKIWKQKFNHNLPLLRDCVLVLLSITLQVYGMNYFIVYSIILSTLVIRIKTFQSIIIHFIHIILYIISEVLQRKVIFKGKEWNEFDKSFEFDFVTRIITIFSIFVVCVFIAASQDKVERQSFIFQYFIQNSMQQSYDILSNLFPQFVMGKIKKGDWFIADEHQNVTIVFCDIYKLEEIVASNKPKELIELLNEIQLSFDRLCEIHKVHKIETVGKTYMACAGLNYTDKSKEQAKHNDADRCILLAIDMINRCQSIILPNGKSLQVNIGINSGPVIAGIVGNHKPQFCLVGDTVNIASRMSSINDQPMSIRISESTYQKSNKLDFIFLQYIQEVKGKGSMATYLVQKRIKKIEQRVSILSDLKQSNAFQISRRRSVLRDERNKLNYMDNYSVSDFEESSPIRLARSVSRFRSSSNTKNNKSQDVEKKAKEPLLFIQQISESPSSQSDNHNEIDQEIVQTNDQQQVRNNETILETKSDSAKEDQKVKQELQVEAEEEEDEEENEDEEDQSLQNIQTQRTASTLLKRLLIQKGILKKFNVQNQVMKPNQESQFMQKGQNLTQSETKDDIQIQKSVKHENLGLSMKNSMKTNLKKAFNQEIQQVQADQVQHVLLSRFKSNQLLKQKTLKIMNQSVEENLQLKVKIPQKESNFEYFDQFTDQTNQNQKPNLKLPLFNNLMEIDEEKKQQRFYQKTNLPTTSSSKKQTECTKQNQSQLNDSLEGTQPQNYLNQTLDQSIYQNEEAFGKFDLKNIKSESIFSPYFEKRSFSDMSKGIFQRNNEEIIQIYQDESLSKEKNKRIGGKIKNYVLDVLKMLFKPFQF